MSSIFDPGRSDRRRAADLAQSGIISGGRASGPGGIGANFDFTNGVGSIGTSLGDFQPLLDQLRGLASGAFDQAGGGLPQDLRDLGDQTISSLGDFNLNVDPNSGDFAGLGDIFQSALGTANADPFDLGAGISSRLRALSERRNQRLVNKTFDRLKSSGKLGTTGGAGIAGELDRNLSDQGLQFDLAGLQAGQGIQRDAFGRALGAMQGREGILNRRFGQEMGAEQLGGQRALQQFGVGSDLFRQFLANQAQGTQLGLAGLGGATSLSQLPLAFLMAQMQGSSMASNSRFGAAGVNQQNAAMARSPFLEAINAFGSLASSIAPGGFLGNPTGGG